MRNFDTYQLSQKIDFLEEMVNLGPIWAWNCLKLYLKILSKNFLKVGIVIGHPKKKQRINANFP